MILDDLVEKVSKALEGQPKRGRPSGQIGTLNRDIKYMCDTCKEDVGRDRLFIREATFIKLSDRKRLRTRRCNWLCDKCMVAHPDYTRERYADSPGMRDVHAKE